MCDYKQQGIECAVKQNAAEGMKKLREAAKNCRTKSDYAAFMRSIMPIDIEETADGIVLHLHKKNCTCTNPGFIEKCGSDLCECTKSHEEYAWSLFFGKSVKVEILESFLRGGKDCVIKICI